MLVKYSPQKTLAPPPPPADLGASIEARLQQFLPPQ
jgi:hypothetical protein